MMHDIHSHIIYGVDDGAENLQQSLNMLDAAKAAGIDRIYATPHMRSKDADVESIYDHFACLHQYAADRKIDLRLGFEYNIQAIDNDSFESAKDYTLAGTDILLLEMPFTLWPPLWENIIYRLQGLQLKIIIAHPERYEPIQKNPGIIKILADMGCFFQCNASSVVKGSFKKNKVIRHLCKVGKLDFVASDAHSIYEYELYKKAVQKLSGKQNYLTIEDIIN